MNVKLFIKKNKNFSKKTNFSMTTSSVVPVWLKKKLWQAIDIKRLFQLLLQMLILIAINSMKDDFQK
jgi:uncharacterized membrane protein